MIMAMIYWIIGFFLNAILGLAMNSGLARKPLNKFFFFGKELIPELPWQIITMCSVVYLPAFLLVLGTVIRIIVFCVVNFFMLIFRGIIAFFGGSSN